jgi:cyclopropane fatty-acyl-phospholipid synthase-like methyltransferase
MKGQKMDRSVWLKEIRRVLEEQESLLAPRYDEFWGDIAPLHQQCFERFLSLCPPQAHLLDAACGTGKYWSLILASGRTVFGVDQSQGSLLRAQEKFPDVPTKKVGLQEMDYDRAFDAAVCMDALELISPEDWPLVMRNLHRAIEPDGYLYFTVEITDEQNIQESFAEGQRMGLPVVYGEAEWLEEGGYHWGRGGWYHFYPEMEQVREWARQAGFQVIEEEADEEYHHFLVQR